MDLTLRNLRGCPRWDTVDGFSILAAHSDPWWIFNIPIFRSHPERILIFCKSSSGNSIVWPRLRTSILKAGEGQKNVHAGLSAFLLPCTSSFGKFLSHATELPLLILRPTSEPRDHSDSSGWRGWDEGLFLCPDGFKTIQQGAVLPADGCESFLRGTGTQNIVIFWLEIRSMIFLFKVSPALPTSPLLSYSPAHRPHS